VQPRSRQFVVAGGAAIALAAVLWIGREPAREQERTQPPQAQVQRDTAQAPAPQATSPRPAVPAAEAPQPLPSADPRARELEQRAQFQQEVRAFFAQAPALSLEQRTARAQAIAQQITRYEAAGEVAAAEALTLRAALIRETVDDPAEQVEAMTALQDHYRQQGSAKQAEWDERVDPEFELYKAREREIVAEVGALSRIPDGLSREEYLRRRLQSARESLN
jgi:type IV secretory pathway VirB10-like protein